MQHQVRIDVDAKRISPKDRELACHMKARASGFDWEGAMAAALAGDAGRYRELLNESARWLRRFYARKLPADMIDDVVQETIMAVHTKRATFTPGRPYLPWLATIARYKWVDSIRSSKRQQADELIDFAIESHESDVLCGVSIRALLGRLRAAQAEAIRLVKLEGRSIKEAADLSGQSESLVKVNIHRGILAMRAMLAGKDLAFA